jgi:hypothetical protein
MPPPVDRSDRQAELEAAAQPLSAELDAVRARLKAIRREEKRLTLREVELYVALGNIVCELLDGRIIPYRQQTRYLDSGALGCRRGVAQNARYAYRLHTQYNRSFAILQNWGPGAWRGQWSTLAGTGHDDRGLSAAFREMDAIAFAHLTRSQLDRGQRNEAAKLLLQNERMDWRTVRQWLVDAAGPPRPELSEEEQTQGLSSFMADSGAYSVQQNDDPIAVDQYCDFLLNNPWITTYISLDVIEAPEHEQAAQESFDNFMRMRERGLLTPIPTVHFGEDEGYWIRRYLDEGCDYIALGGAANEEKYRSWKFYDDCFRVIDSCGIPVKVHAFGVGAPDTLFRYPFTSCDATTWIMRAQQYWDDGSPSTNLSRLGGRDWQSSLTYHQKLAAATYLEALDANRLERLIQLNNRPDFKYYLGFTPTNSLAIAAIRVVRHRHALVSYYYMRNENDANRIKQFVQDPETASYRRYRIGQDLGMGPILTAPRPIPTRPIREGRRQAIDDPYALTLEMHNRYTNTRVGMSWKDRERGDRPIPDGTDRMADMQQP